MATESKVSQPNLQAILSDYRRAISDPKMLNTKQAIDAIYAGLLAVINDNEPISNKTTGTNKPNYEYIMARNKLKASQREALKWWCYGDKETME